MAKELNRNRMRDTKILLAVVVLTGIFLTSPAREDVLARDVMRALGFLLAAFCAVGRLYASAFIGGMKNEKLITHGPYSMCRNPLYFCSLMGAAGVGLMSAHVLSFVVITAGFLFIYRQLIAREEAFLTEKFGQEFVDFTKQTPRLMPSLKNYHCPPELLFQVKYLNFALRDCIWWFAPLAVFLMSDILIAKGVLKPLFCIF